MRVQTILERNSNLNKWPNGWIGNCEIAWLFGSIPIAIGWRWGYYIQIYCKWTAAAGKTRSVTIACWHWNVTLVAELFLTANCTNENEMKKRAEIECFRVRWVNLSTIDQPPHIYVRFHCHIFVQICSRHHFIQNAKNMPHKQFYRFSWASA